MKKDAGFHVYTCSHDERGTKPCPKGCHKYGRLVQPTPPAPPVTCPACLQTGEFHDHGCRVCGQYSDSCECADSLLRLVLKKGTVPDDIRLDIKKFLGGPNS